MQSISKHDFEKALASLGPFENNPTIAIAVSGGCDSMCLTLLLNDWTVANDGKLIALTVDHGLRSESATEAHQVSDWLSQRSIEHHILTWSGKKPTSGIQEAARKARYSLLEDWCLQHKVLHLFVAHNADDQAETI